MKAALSCIVLAIAALTALADTNIFFAKVVNPGEVLQCRIIGRIHSELPKTPDDRGAPELHCAILWQCELVKSATITNVLCVRTNYYLPFVLSGMRTKKAHKPEPDVFDAHYDSEKMRLVLLWGTRGGIYAECFDCRSLPGGPLMDWRDALLSGENYDLADEGKIIRDKSQIEIIIKGTSPPANKSTNTTRRYRLMEKKWLFIDSE